MADVKDDIEKYLNGELSRAEMHAFEKRALKDPFLAEALEGAVSIIAKDFVADVSELKQRLANRQKVKRTWLTPLRIAAALALLITASYFIYTFVKSDEPITLTQNASKEVPAKSRENKISDSVSTSVKEKTEQDLLSFNQPVPAQPKRKAKEELKPTLEPAQLTVASGEGKAGRAEAAAEEHVNAVEMKLEEAKADEHPVVETDKSPKVEESLKQKDKSVARQKAYKPSDVAGVASGPSFQRVISGKVTSADDGTAIPGANVLIQGTSRGTVSDANGNYQVAAELKEDSLVISFIGYETKEVKVPAGQSQVNVALPTDVSQLNEVIVTSYERNEGESETEAPVQLAEPQGGKRAYNKYLERNLHYPQQALEQKIEGRVTIEFTVQSTGALADFTVVHGIDFGCNEEVIRLVKEGPPWKPSVKAEVKIKSTVRVGVKFKLPK